MDIALRRLRAEDIEQVIEIEREAFSPLWFGNSLKRDLNNRYARYLVACQPESEPEELDDSLDVPELTTLQPSDASLWGRMVRGVRGFVGKPASAGESPGTSPATSASGFRATKPTSPRLPSGKASAATASASCSSSAPFG